MKPYEKPRILIENFELSQSIATCGWDMNTQTKENCQAVGDEEDFGNDPGMMIFTDAPCNITDWEAYCYQPGSGPDAFRIFNS